MRLFAPFIPHITEELYSDIFADKFNQSGSIHHRGNWPEISLEDKNALKIGDIALEVIFNIRKFKSDHNLSVKTPLESFVINSDTDIKAVIEDLQNVCNAEKIIMKSQAGNLISDIITKQ